uniref:(northern house mosquito) hypothetical protein n=1 Tax=Culex pipiens TaxID=7175 RepID=A0A8D8NG32_CULPI
MCARSLFCTCACVVVGVSTAALLGRWFHRYYTATVCGDISGLIHNLAHKLHQFQALWQTFTCTFLPKCRQHARHTHSHSPIVLTFPNFCPVTLFLALSISAFFVAKSKLVMSSDSELVSNLIFFRVYEQRLKV